MYTVVSFTNAQLTERMLQMEQRMEQMEGRRSAGAADLSEHNGDSQVAPATKSLVTTTCTDAHVKQKAEPDLETDHPLYKLAVDDDGNVVLMSVYVSATALADGLDMNLQRAQGEFFERLAKEYLAKEMEGPSKTTTAQGLLLLSERALALGNNQQSMELRRHALSLADL
ncbi:hypothetical protein F503_07095 [Ophiostoma piceae UAMH 11346]|uniref:Uncharacterized protein n=1 Tax=Ophiostoma piceae (strain UAMH 11346) TaxID=1262450 RepID=S3C715_OPHP1|nr:hypothetical protein F503_07095 [Ophiostoma piceae UAMH 11346]